MRYELIRPKSASVPAYADYEYLIRWVGRSGADNVFMFYDAEVEAKVRNSVINEDDSSRIEALVENDSREIVVMAHDLSKQDMEAILSMFAAKVVWRIKKDGSVERFAPDANSFSYKLRDGRYEVEIKLIAANLKVWK